MNEIVRIHIAGVAYEIDIAAKKQLDSYIAAVRRSLADAKDVLEDIELRITEILGERGVYKNDVIKLSDIDAVREQLGDPKDFSSSEPHSRPRSEEKIADKIRYEFADKKYFRDSENGIIGGVVEIARKAVRRLDAARSFCYACNFHRFFPFCDPLYRSLDLRTRGSHHYRTPRYGRQAYQHRKHQTIR